MAMQHRTVIADVSREIVLYRETSNEMHSNPTLRLLGLEQVALQVLATCSSKAILVGLNKSLVVAV